MGGLLFSKEKQRRSGLSWGRGKLEGEELGKEEGGETAAGL